MTLLILPVLPLALPTELWYMILQRTKDYWTLKGTYLTCWLFAEYYEAEETIKINHSLPELTVIVNNIDEDWDWRLLAESKRIPMEFKLSHPFISKYLVNEVANIPWKLIVKYKCYEKYASVVSWHKDLDYSIVIDNQSLDWDWTSLSYNMDLHKLDMLSDLMKSELYWRAICRRNDITYQFAINNLKWVGKHCTKIKAEVLNRLPFDSIFSMCKKNKIAKLSGHPEFPISMLSKLRSDDVDWEAIVCRTNVPFVELCETILKYRNLESDYYYIYMNICHLGAILIGTGVHSYPMKLVRATSPNNAHILVTKFCDQMSIRLSPYGIFHLMISDRMMTLISERSQSDLPVILAKIKN